jgi:ATP-dependent helicase/nuclease subunit A
MVAPRIGIRAGAGAGKTGVLVERYLRHVFNDGGRPEQILAITFTRKAAAEMKRRIVDRLRSAGLKSAAQEAHVGPISTMHGYCERLLREYPFDAGLDPRFEVLSDAQDGDLLRECARRSLSNAISLSEPEQALVRQVGGERSYATHTSEASAQLIAWICSVVREFRTAGVSLESLGDLAESPSNILDSWSKYAEERCMAESGEALPAGWQENPQLLKAGKNRKPWLNSPYDAASEKESAILTQGLCALAARTWRFLLEEFEHLRCLDFAELEARACRLLAERPEVLKGKYRWLIVDEAQDLNPVQYRILSATPCESLTLAGDPQQAIYGFRGAERRLYLEYLQDSANCDLTANFRSVPAIVCAVDEVFSPLWTDDYLSMRAHRDPEAAEITDPFDAAARSVEVWRVGKYPERQVAQGVLQLIEEGVTPGDITVLVRAANRIDDLVNPLRAQGLSIALLGAGHNYFLRTEIRDLASAMHALVDPQDDLSYLSLLRSPLVGLSLDGVMRIGLEAKAMGRRVGSVVGVTPLSELDSDRLAEFRLWFEPLSKRADRLAGWEVLAAIFAATSLDTRFAMLEGGEQLIANAHKLLSLAIERRELSCSRFATWLDSQQRIRSHMGDAEGSVPDANSVRISTIHSAKGLEWKTVVVQAVEGRWSGRDNLCVIPEQGLLVVATDEYKPLSFEAAMTMKEEEEREERRRLLYVAMTRAEDRLCLAVLQDAKDDWYAKIANRLLPKGKPLDWITLRDLRPPPRQQAVEQ